jgi:hypothetical protein
MFQRKLIALLSLVAVLALMAGVSYASPSRTDALTGEVGSLRVFMDDYANIFTFPTSVVRQNNLVLADLGTNSGGSVNSVSFDNQNLTIIKNFPRFGAIAFDMKQSATNSNYPGSLNHEALDLIWGKAFNKMDLAIRFDLTSSKYEATSTTGGVTSTFKEVGNSFGGFPAAFPDPFIGIGPDLLAGFPMELNTMGFSPSVAFHMQNDNRIEAVLTYRTYTLDRVEGAPSPAINEKWEDGGNGSYALYARGIFNQDDKNVWYPVAFYQKDDLSWEITNAGNVTGVTRSADETYSNYGLGIANNMKVNDNNLLIFGLVAGQTKHEYERGDDNTGGGPTDGTKSFTYTNTYLPIFFAGVETNATRWLTVRMSASHNLMSDETETVDFGTPADTGNIKTRGAEFGFALGTGIRWNNLDIDMVLNEEFPLSGGYILSGNEATPFTRVSATYHF